MIMFLIIVFALSIWNSILSLKYVRDDLFLIINILDNDK